MENLNSVLAIELFNASQALYYRQPLKSSSFIEQLVSGFREEVPVVKQDKVMATEIANAKRFLHQFDIDKDLMFCN